MNAILLFQVFQSDTVFADCVSKLQIICDNNTFFVDADIYLQGKIPRIYIMFQGIFNQHLDACRNNIFTQGFIVARHVDAQGFTETDLFKINVRIYEVKFFLQRHFGFFLRDEQITVHGREFLGKQVRFAGILIGQGRKHVQAVEQKMRIDLPLQVFKLILRLFLFDLCQPGFVCEKQVVIEKRLDDEHNDAIA